MHSYPWRDVYFFSREQAYVLSDTGGSVNVTPIHQPTCVTECALKTAFKEVVESGLWCAASAAYWFAIDTIRVPVWAPTVGSCPHISFHRAPPILTSNRIPTKETRVFQLAGVQAYIADNYLQYSAFQTRAEQPEDNLYKQTWCNYECITTQQTGNQHAMTCRANLQN